MRRNWKKLLKKAEKIATVDFKDVDIKNISKSDLGKIEQLEKKIYEGTGLAMGRAMIEDILNGNGLEYSIIAFGKRPGDKKAEVIGYIAAVENETDEDNPCVYLEDIALLPEARGQKIGWNMLKNLIAKLKEKAEKKNEPVLLDMHLRENSQRFFERHQNELEHMGVTSIEEALVPNYYGEGKDALYKVYQIKAD